MQTHVEYSRSVTCIDDARSDWIKKLTVSPILNLEDQEFQTETAACPAPLRGADSRASLTFPVVDLCKSVVVANVRHGKNDNQVNIVRCYFKAEEARRKRMRRRR